MFNLLLQFTEAISEQLEQEKEKTEQSNRTVYLKLNALEEAICKLKEANTLFENRDNLIMPPEWWGLKETVINDISAWKKRKTKMTVEDAQKASKEFDEKLHKWFDSFQQKLEKSNQKYKTLLLQRVEEWYATAELDQEYEVVINTKLLPTFTFPSVSEQLMQLKEDEYIHPKEDFIDKFFSKKQPQELKEAIHEINYYYQKWREFAIQGIEPLLEKSLFGQYQILQEYFDALTEGYQKYIEELLMQKIKEKEWMTQQLSAEEKRLQADYDWFICFCDQLQTIERK